MAPCVVQPFLRVVPVWAKPRSDKPVISGHASRLSKRVRELHRSTHGDCSTVSRSQIIRHGSGRCWREPRGVGRLVGGGMAQLIVFKGCVRRRRWAAPGRLSANRTSVSKVCVIRSLLPVEYDWIEKERHEDSFAKPICGVIDQYVPGKRCYENGARNGRKVNWPRTRFFLKLIRRKWTQGCSKAEALVLRFFSLLCVRCSFACNFRCQLVAWDRGCVTERERQFLPAARINLPIPLLFRLIRIGNGDQFHWEFLWIVNYLVVLPCLECIVVE